MDDDNKDTETLLMNLVAANYELGDILHQLFKMMVLEHHNRSVSTTNPDAALAEILGNASKKELRFLKSLKQEINTEKFYDTRNVPYKFKTLICIDELDVTCIVEILKHINGFKTNKKALKGKKCAKIGKGHVKCCVNCVHTCKYCGKTSCSPDCDAADVDHKCLNNTCNQGKIECNKNNTVCCPTCGLCWKCGQMLPRGKQCPILILCISIEIIHHLRNMFSHISPIDYTLFLSKKSTLPYFPKCNTWSELSKELKVAGENILSFMSNPCQFSRTDPLSEDDKFERSYQLRLTLGNKATLMEKCTDKIAKSMLKLQATEITNDLKQHLSDLLEKFEVSVKKIMEKEFKKFKENEETDNVFKRESGLSGIVVGHPFDTVKVRLQTQFAGSPKYSGSLNCFMQIIKKESVFGLYKGIMSPLYGQIAINAIVFGLYGNSLRLLGSDNATSQFIAGGAAGLVQSIIASPMELVKIRLQMQGEGVGKIDLSRRDMRYHYASPYDCFKKIYEHEGGVKGVFRGFNLTVWREIPSFGVYFAAYHYLCEKTNAISEDSISIPKLLFCGGWAGIVSWIVTYPLDVIKTRQQMDGMTEKREFKNAIDCALKSYQKEGYSVFFRGLGITMLRAFPTNGATLTTVSVFLNFFEDNKNT